jgi:hypothetical protein
MRGLGLRCGGGSWWGLCEEFFSSVCVLFCIIISCHVGLFVYSFGWLVRRSVVLDTPYCLQTLGLL